MGKVGVAVALLLGGCGITAGGVFLAKSFNVDYKLLNSLEEFKNSNGGGCVQSIFPGIEKMDKENVGETSTSDEKIGSTSGDGSSANGCLVVNWDKWKEGNNKDKGKGNFRFLWALANGNKGFIVYATVDTPTPPPSDDNKKLKVKGVRYVLEKKDGNKGEIIKGKKVDTDKDLEISKLPKPGTKLLGDGKETKGKFVENDSDLSKLCEANECKDKKPHEYFAGYWVWQSEKNSKETADKGTSNLSDGGKDIYEDTNWNMQTVLTNVKGEGKNKVLYPFVS